MIIYNEEKKTFVIETEKCAYVFCIEKSGCLKNLYFGEKLNDSEGYPTSSELRSFCRHTYMSERKIREEYPTYGGVFFFEPSLVAELPLGVCDTELRYASHVISEDGNLLEVTMKDAAYPFYATLIYRIYEGIDLIDKSVRVKNGCDEPVKLRSLMSGTVYLPDNRKLGITTMSSHWGREYNLQRQDFSEKKHVIESRSLYADSEYMPWFAIDDNADEEQGEVWFGTLRWPGNWKICAEKTSSGVSYVTAGLNDFDFCKTLRSGEEFTSPVFSVGYTSGGFGSASRIFHRFQREVFAPREWAKKPLPIVYNAWAAMEFKITAEALLPLVDKAADLGCELFVVDDGWFGSRNDDTSGLGDWFPNPVKFPDGLLPISEKCHARGMLFGLWIEPEMVSTDSDLYRAHPDWIIGLPGREKETFRNQLMLNVSLPCVRDYMIDCIDRLIADNALDYLKWDSNRYVSQPGFAGCENPDERREMWYGYIENMLSVFRFVKEKYPHVIIENCAAGGMRSELSLGEFCSRINRSDNQDPRDALFLHEGFTQLHRSRSAGGGCHIAGVQGGLNDRFTNIPFKAHVGMMGSLSVGFDLRKLSDETFSEIKELLAFHKKIRDTVQNGEMYRLVSPRNTGGEYSVFEFVSQDKSEAVLFCFGINISMYRSFPSVKLLGLCDEAIYETEGRRPASGEALRKVGFDINPLIGDYDSRVFVLKRKN